MSLVRKFITWLAGAQGPRSQVPAAPARFPHFIYVKIPEPLMPLDRGSRYEDPIDGILGPLGLGEVSGGGAQLGDERPDGTRPIEFCGVDVDVLDVDRARERLRDTLVELGAPQGTEIQYSLGDEKLQDELHPGGWRLAQPRTFLHPGFGI